MTGWWSAHNEREHSMDEDDTRVHLLIEINKCNNGSFVSVTNIDFKIERVFEVM